MDIGRGEVEGRWGEVEAGVRVEVEVALEVAVGVEAEMEWRKS